MGRPAKFSSVQELEDLVDGYFIDCKAKDEPVTITGLALHLDTTRETLMDYEKGSGFRAEFSDAIKRAKLRVECDYEKALRKYGRAGDIFGLKNFGWQDKSQADVKVTAGVVVVKSDEDKELLDSL